MASFVQLYETSFSTVDANGNLSFQISGPQLTRTWLGSLTFIGLPGGTQIAVSVGAQAYGSMSAPGPGGLFELLHGISLVATASGLTPGVQASMVLAGADFPAAQAPPYFGPSLITATATAGSGGEVSNTPNELRFSYAGALVAGTSDTTDIPGGFVSCPPGSTTFITRLWGLILGGTSVNVTVRVNTAPAYSGPVDVPDLTGITITPTPGGFILPTALEVFDLDYIDIVLDTLTGTPTGLAAMVDVLVVPTP
jgi:hypothetical protein